jgi:hypothetical protein
MGEVNNVPSRIKAMQHLDISFDKFNLSSVRNEVKRIENILHDENLWSSSHEDLVRFKNVKNQLDEQLKIEEIIWRQRSRVMWLMEGDKNTKFFHEKANQRRKKNEASKFMDACGVWWSTDDHVGRILIDYFSDIFSSSNLVDVDVVCEVVRGKLNDEHKEMFASSFTSQ